MQGIALVTFPAASGIFTSPSEYGLSSTAYGAMFVPQAITAVGVARCSAPTWARRVGTRRVYLSGSPRTCVAMVAARRQLAVHRATSPSPTDCCLLATTSLGVGFGFTVPALNTFTAAFNPTKVDSSVLVLNALLGLGTALAPLFVAVFVGLGFWWGLPVLTGAACSPGSSSSASRCRCRPAHRSPPATAASPAARRHPGPVLDLRRVRARSTASARR